MPGVVKPGSCGQLPSCDGSPPIRTQVEWEGVGPSKMNSWCQPGGETPAFGGVVIVHMVPEHEKAGKIVRDPIVFPWVLDVAVETWRKQKKEQI
jgi:hypothetical protein